MGLFRKRKSRATRRAEARAIKARAKLEAKLTAKNEARRIKHAQRSADKALKAQVKAQQDSDRAALKVAEAELKAAREGKLLSPTRIRRVLTVSRLLAPILTPVMYRAAMATRALIDQRRADQLGIPLAQIGQFSGQRRPTVGTDRRGRAVAADGAGKEAQRRRNQAVRVGDHRTARRPVGGRHRRGEHAGRAAPRRPLRDLVATRRHRGGPDGPARVDLTAVRHAWHTAAFRAS